MGYDKAYCLRAICLYLKDYLSDQQFEELFSAYISAFQTYLEEELYLDIVFTKFWSKEERIRLRTKLHQYVLQQDLDLYQNTNDVSVERMIAAGAEDELIHILKKRYEKKAELYIQCDGIYTASELIHTIKQSLQFPAFCGLGWDSIEDLIYDIVFPEKLIFVNWDKLERRLPRDTDILKKLFEQNASERCVIIMA